jgi:hypothetical protein
MRFRMAGILVLLSGTLIAVACSSPTGPSGASGTLNVMLKDSPFNDARAVLVTFSKVSAHKDTDADGAWTDLTFAGGGDRRTCDLKKLETAQDLLGVGTLAEGHYTQIRLVVASAKLDLTNASALTPCAPGVTEPTGTSAILTIPSGEVKLNREFNVRAGGTTKITLDFDGDRSIILTGNNSYMMNPVITVVGVE